MEGQSFNPDGMKIQATYSDDTTEILTDFTITPAGALQVTDHTVTVSGEWGGMEYSYDFAIQVIEKEVSEIKIHTPPVNTIYAADESIDLSGLKVAAYYTDFPEKPVILEDGDYEAVLNGGELTVIYTYNGRNVFADMKFTLLESLAPVENTEGFYELDSSDDLVWFANQVSNLKNTSICATVTAEIIASDLFMGVGKSGAYFAGTFDGGNHTITLSMTTDATAGLFTGVSGGTIRNVVVAGSVVSDATTSGVAGVAAYVGKDGAVIENCVNKAAINGGGSVGGIVGKTAEAVTTISNCTNEGTVTSEGDYAGGIIAYAAKSVTITDCINLGMVSGNSRVGGIAGFANGLAEDSCVSIQRCGNDGVITTSSTAGGILGYSESAYDQILLCYNGASVTATALAGNSGVGGLAGFFAGRMDSSYNLGSISCSDNAVISEFHNAGVGGLIGLAYACRISNSYQSGGVSGDGSSQVKTGSLVGYVYYGTTNISNAYYLAAEHTEAYGGSVNDMAILSGDYACKTEEELVALAETLGSNFKANSNKDYHGGFPVLAWERADHVHVWDEGVITKEPSCTKPGEKTVTCVEGCGVTLTQQIEPLGHQPDGGVVLSEATCMQYGKLRYTCTVCSEFWHQAIEKTEHQYKSEVTMAGCTTGGYSVHTCTRCGSSYTDHETSPLGHSWDKGSVRVEATCTRSGEKVFHCTRGACDAVSKKTLPSTGHQWGKGVTAKVASCTASGLLRYDCVCGASKTAAIQALGHGWGSGTTVKEATCTEDGTLKVDCIRCGKTENQVIAAVGHDYQVTEEKSECSADVGAFYCCTICEDHYHENDAVLGHSWDDGVVTTEASCTEAGVKTFTCKDCQETRTEEIQKTGHRFEDGICTNCGEAENIPDDVPEEKNGGQMGTWLLFAALLAVIALVLNRMKIFK